MATFEFWLENIILERGRAFVEANSLDEAMGLMRRQIDDGDYEASWNYAETLSCRILEVEDERGKSRNVTTLCDQMKAYDACGVVDNA